jgi:predicted PurR-regulated permease PerM
MSAFITKPRYNKIYIPSNTNPTVAFDSKHKKWILVLVFLVLLSLAIFMLKSYLGAIFVGALVAYFIQPVYKWLEKKLKSQKASKAIIISSLIIVSVLFLSLFIAPLVNQTLVLYQESGVIANDLIKDLQNCETSAQSSICKISTKLENTFGKEEILNKTRQALQNISFFIFDSLRGLLASVVNLFIFLFILIFSIFYFIDNGKTISNKIIEIIPLEKNHKKRIVERLKQTINAVVGGNFITALMQGIAGGLIFFFLQIPSPLFWGLLMGILAFIPMIGPPIIWIPTAIYLFIQGKVTSAIILTIYCLIVIGSIENILKPKLIAKKINLSSFATLLGVLGGLTTFGILGLFIGPIIVALLVTCVDIYQEMK